MKRNVYLKTIDLDEVPELLTTMFEQLNVQTSFESISTIQSLNRVTYKAVYADVSSPYFSACAMDGVALNAVLTYSASETNPVVIKVGDFKYVNTGNVMTEEFDSVVMIEDIQEHSDGSISLIKSVRPFQDVRPIGEDIVEGDMIISSNHKIRSIDISALLSGGINEMLVIKKPRVLIIPTGNEIIRDKSELKKGKIIDSNSFYTKSALEELGVEAIIDNVLKDDISSLENKIIEATKNYDMVIVGAGSSAGSKDFTKLVIKKLGTVHAHGIAIKPGKPVVIGEVNKIPVIGLPGFPVSTYLAFQLVVKPLIEMYLKQIPDVPVIIKAKLTKKIYSSLKSHEFIRCKVGLINGEYIATPLVRGAGITMSLVKADGIFVIKKNREGYNAFDTVEVALLKNISEIKQSLIATGSHDILLDKIDNILSASKNHLSSTHVGSFGGILAIKAKECHIAPVHILDSVTGEYNIHILTKYLNEDYALVRGVSRIQGILTKKGNPKNILSLADIAKKDINFVNRQKGSGTRILLDYLLAKENISKTDIKGYDFELQTHMMVASSIKDGNYDAGLAVQSVANMKDLDFIKLAEENYDFLVLKSTLKTNSYQKFIEVLKSKELRDSLESIGGYVFHNIGEVIK
ncbi:MAG: molybdopterin biosynthesis protein [Candidatus Izemoplasma sp.]